MAITPPGPTRPVTPPPAPSPKPPPRVELDRKTLTAAGTFGVLLRNGQTWQRVKLLEMDQWSLLVETEQGKVLLPKHAVDAYLLGPS